MKASLTLESWKASNILVYRVTSRSFSVVLNSPLLTSNRFPSVFIWILVCELRYRICDNLLDKHWTSQTKVGWQATRNQAERNWYTIRADNIKQNRNWNGRRVSDQNNLRGRQQSEWRPRRRLVSMYCHDQWNGTHAHHQSSGWSWFTLASSLTSWKALNIISC